MTNWFKKSVNLAYFSSKDGPLKEKPARLRGIAETLGLSGKAEEKLEWIIFHQTVGLGSVKATASYLGIIRKTLHKWIKRFDEKNPLTLEEKSRSPIQKREWEVSRQEEERIVSLRKAHIKWGKKKLKKLYIGLYKENISAWKIERVVRKWNLYPDRRKIHLAFYVTLMKLSSGGMECEG